MDAILPAAGSAQRMSGIPKFLLPSDDKYTALIEHHINGLTDISNNIYLPTKKNLIPLIESLNLNFESITILEVDTKSMSETILKVLDYSNAETFLLAMPDTYFYGQKPYRLFNPKPEYADVACWKIRDEQRGKLGEVTLDEDNYIQQIVDKNFDNGFELAWGALTFSRKLAKYIYKEDPHIGYAMKHAIDDEKKISGFKVEGSYFDCGTPSEYIEMFKQVIK